MKKTNYLLKNCHKHFKLFLLYFCSCTYQEQLDFINMIDSFDFDFWREEENV